MNYCVKDFGLSSVLMPMTKLTLVVASLTTAAASIPYVTIGKDKDGKDVNLPLVVSVSQILTRR